MRRVGIGSCIRRGIESSIHMPIVRVFPTAAPAVSAGAQDSVVEGSRRRMGMVYLYCFRRWFLGWFLRKVYMDSFQEYFPRITSKDGFIGLVSNMVSKDGFQGCFPRMVSKDGFQGWFPKMVS